MKGTDTYTYGQARENLRIAVMALNAGSTGIAFEMLERLAHYVMSEHAASSLGVDELAQLRHGVEGALAQFTLKDDECLWEKSCEILAMLKGRD